MKSSKKAEPKSNDEERILRKLFPSSAMYNSLDNAKLSSSYQNILHELTNSFLNGGFSVGGYIGYPMLKGTSKSIGQNLSQLQEVSNTLHQRGIIKGSVPGIKKPIKSERECAQAISIFYADVDHLANKGNKLVIKKKCQQFSFTTLKGSDKKYLGGLKDLQAYVQSNLNGLEGFYLHGSFATKDYVLGWSDVDTIAIISDASMRDPKKLIALRGKLYQLRKFFYAIDPLQHHGITLITKKDMERYPAPYFPLEIFPYAQSLLKQDREYTFRVRESYTEALQALFYFIDFFRKLHSERHGSFSSYTQKYIFHAISLFPALYLQALGINMYKKFTFDYAKKHFSKKEWQVIDQVTKIRDDWKQKKMIGITTFYEKLNPLVSHRANAAINDLFSSSVLNKEEMKKMIADMVILSEKGWQRVLEESRL